MARMIPAQHIPKSKRPIRALGDLVQVTLTARDFGSKGGGVTIELEQPTGANLHKLGDHVGEIANLNGASRFFEGIEIVSKSRIRLVFGS